jgi:hypothetical protein
MVRLRMQGYVFGFNTELMTEILKGWTWVKEINGKRLRSDEFINQTRKVARHRYEMDVQEKGRARWFNQIQRAYRKFVWDTYKSLELAQSETIDSPLGIIMGT